MARLAFAWELGALSGYATLIGRIAQAAVGDGHECIFVVKDLAAAAPHLPARLGHLLQAPAPGGKSASRVRVQTSYATLLHNTGYNDATALAARLRAWIDLFRMAGTDRVLARHSPTAILAARLLEVPVLHYGNGFTMPPRRSPWPTFRPDLKIAEAALQQNESRVLSVLNEALDRVGYGPLESLSQLFANVPALLLGAPELDHYARDEPLPTVDFPHLGYGEAPVWPDGEGLPRVFAALLPTPAAQSWLDALARLPARTLVRFPSDPSGVQPHGRVRIAAGPVDYGIAVRQCDAVISYGTHNLANEALLAGRPMALIAHTPDHLMMAQRVQALGAGIALPERADASTAAALAAFLAEPAYRTAAQRFAERHAKRNGVDAPAAILRHAMQAAVAPLQSSRAGHP